MFGLFNKRKPLTVKEIEDGIYDGFISFINFIETETTAFPHLISSYKRMHPKMCPMSQSLGKGVIHGAEIYGFVWVYILGDLQKKGLKVNLNLFERGEYFGDILDGYVQIARNRFRSSLYLMMNCVSRGSLNDQLTLITLNVDDKIMIEELIKKSLLDKKTIQSNVHWYKAIAFTRFINTGNIFTYKPNSIFFQSVIDTPENCTNLAGDFIEQNEVKISVDFIRNKEDYTTTIDASVSTF